MRPLRGTTSKEINVTNGLSSNPSLLGERSHHRWQQRMRTQNRSDALPYVWRQWSSSPVATITQQDFQAVTMTLTRKVQINIRFPASCYKQRCSLDLYFKHSSVVPHIFYMLCRWVLWGDIFTSAKHCDSCLTSVTQQPPLTLHWQNNKYMYLCKN